ncbi:MAG TPA: DUF5677 domain-containing protein [Candidatus Avalokitesvara rifleensis]|uniref:DUF5677 domain-containing protein n=1 Tax=Candidatus Avalokitesvara rifleensis TaxID=3367620 RepID=UPI002712CCDB|nr:DUF5677 domain-containing protein [Candidatus Brocadiales bacterium]
MLEKDEIETEQWRQKCLEKYKPFFDLNNKLFQLAEIATNKITRDIPLHDVMAFLFGKAHKTFQAVDILMQRGYGQDAAILTRSLFEILVISKWIIAGDSERINKFVNYHRVLRKKLFDMYREDIKNSKFSRTPETEAILNNDDIRKKIGDNYSDVKHLYPNEYLWSGKTIKKMAEEVGLDHDYDYSYGLLSDQVHSNAMVIQDYISFPKEEMEVEYGPSKSFLPEVFFYSTQFFLKFLCEVNQTFQLGFEGRISETAKDRETVLVDNEVLLR